jgi:hypothetical protein
MRCWTAALAAALLVAAHPAEAQMALYDSFTRPIVLPDGRPGEIRVLRGHEYFLPASIRVLALDSERRIIACTRESWKLALSCDKARCRVLDLERRQLLEMEPTAFRHKALGNSDCWSTDMDEQWGWRARDAGAVDELVGNVTLARRFGWRRIGKFVGLNWFGVLLWGIAGACLCAAGRRARNLAQASDVIFCGVALVLAPAIAYAGFFFVSISMLFMADVTGPIWVAAFCAGALLAFVTASIFAKITGSSPRPADP